MATKKPTHASALAAGTARNAEPFAAGFFVRASCSITSAPSPPAKSAKRVCSQGSAASAAPWKNHGRADSAPDERSSRARTSAHTPVRRKNAPGPSGYTVKEFSSSVGDRTTAAHPNQAAWARPVTRRASRHAGGGGTADNAIGNTTTAR